MPPLFRIHRLIHDGLFVRLMTYRCPFIILVTIECWYHWDAQGIASPMWPNQVMQCRIRMPTRQGVRDPSVLRSAEEILDVLDSLKPPLLVAHHSQGRGTGHG